MGNSKDADALTEMEGATLAIVARDGPVTRYGVKEVFRTSPSEFWTGSAGAVYPLMQRLERRGLIQSSAATDNPRKRNFVLTQEGRRRMLSWLSDAELASGMGFDPLRTRLLFSELLSEQQLEDFLDATEALLRNPSPPPMGGPNAPALQRIWEKLRLQALARFRRVVSSKGQK